MKQHATRSRGFTLIELLVVIGIILVLLGLLVPTVQRLMATAMRGKCKGNVRTIANAIIAYATDQGGGSFHRGVAKNTLPNTGPTMENWATLGSWADGTTADDNGNAGGLGLLIRYGLANRELFLCPEAAKLYGNRAPAQTDDGFLYNGTASTLSYSYLSLVGNFAPPNGDPEIPYNIVTEISFSSGYETSTILGVIGDMSPRQVTGGQLLSPNNSINSRNHNQAGQNIGRLDASAEWITDVEGNVDDVYAADSEMDSTVTSENVETGVEEDFTGTLPVRTTIVDTLLLPFAPQ
jgi:prepilin-type N-terminal cleavage/methylation domain-containing protein